MNNRPRRGYSEEEVEAGILKQQLRRAEERRNDPRLVLVDDEWSKWFGPVWQERKD